MAGPWKKHSPFVESIYSRICLAGKLLWQGFAVASPGAGLKGMKKATVAHPRSRAGSFPKVQGLKEGKSHFNVLFFQLEPG